MDQSSSPSASWRDYAAKANAARQWGQAAIALRHHLAACGNDALAQLQLGQTYVELGHFTAAAVAFGAALDDDRVRAEALRSMGQLACARQDFTQALACLEDAAKIMESGSVAAAEVGVEIDRARPLAAAILTAGSRADRIQLLFSGSGMDSIKAAAARRGNLGESDYSYAFAARGFLEVLSDRGAEPELVINPEHVAHGARSFGAKHCVHLRFSPPTNPRMIRGAMNVLIFAWEFDELPMAAGWPHPFSHRTAIVNRFDEIWMPSRHGAAIISGLSKANVRFVPSPVLPRPAGRCWQQGQFVRGEVSEQTLPDIKFVPLSVFPQFQRFLTAHAKVETRSLSAIVRRSPRRPNIFLTIANPHDRRKNLRPLIEAFSEFARGDDDTILLIKSSAFDFPTDTINNLILSHQLARDEESLAAFVSKSIWICNESLEDDDLDELYSIADFYICTPVAEGQNLPLLEAMLRGCVAIAPRHTAMLDYITADNAIIIASRRGAPEESFRQAYELRHAEVDVIEAGDVEIALRRAVSLTPEQRAALAYAAESTVRGQYGAEIVATEWDRLADVVARRVPQGDAA